MDTFEIGYLRYRAHRYRYDFIKLFVVDGTQEEAVQIANHSALNGSGTQPAWRKCDGQDHPDGSAALNLLLASRLTSVLAVAASVAAFALTHSPYAANASFAGLNMP